MLGVGVGVEGEPSARPPAASCSSATSTGFASLTDDRGPPCTSSAVMVRWAGHAIVLTASSSLPAASARRRRGPGWPVRRLPCAPRRRAAPSPAAGAAAWRRPPGRRRCPRAPLVGRLDRLALDAALDQVEEVARGDDLQVVEEHRHGALCDVAADVDDTALAAEVGHVSRLRARAAKRHGVAHAELALGGVRVVVDRKLDRGVVAAHLADHVVGQGGERVVLGPVEVVDHVAVGEEAADPRRGRQQRHVGREAVDAAVLGVGDGVGVYKVARHVRVRAERLVQQVDP